MNNTSIPNPLAKTSLVFGILSAILLPAVFYYSSFSSPLPEEFIAVWFAGLPAIVFGYFAIRKIGRIPAPVDGCRAARVGLCLGFATTILFPTLYVAFAMPFYTRVAVKGNLTKSISNCRQIITVLRIYASDHDGKYPDAALPTASSSNEIFRELFKDAAIDTEVIFGSPVSPFVPDGNIGTSPNYLDAVGPGENHWAFTKGLTDSSPGTIPLVFENPSDASWPPKWDPDFAGTKKPGRTWSAGKVIVGFNDSSVVLEQTISPKGKDISLKPKPDGTPVFPTGNPKLSILNVEK